MRTSRRSTTQPGIEPERDERGAPSARSAGTRLPLFVDDDSPPPPAGSLPKLGHLPGCAKAFGGTAIGADVLDSTLISIVQVSDNRIVIAAYSRHFAARLHSVEFIGLAQLAPPLGDTPAIEAELVEKDLISIVQNPDDPIAITAESLHFAPRLRRPQLPGNCPEVPDR
jgi:hypothetical protein